MHSEKRQPIEVYQPDYSTWPFVVRLLGPAVARSYSTWTLDDVLEKLNDGTAQLWVACIGQEIISAGITRVQEYPQSNTLVLAFAGGDMDGLIEMIPDIKMYAKQLNCNAIECHGRRGWEKVLKPYGFDKISVTVRMEV